MPIDYMTTAPSNSNASTLLSICVLAPHNMGSDLLRDLQWQISRLHESDLVEVILPKGNTHFCAKGLCWARYFEPAASYFETVNAAVSIATGRYLWIIDSANSCLVPYAVEKILQIIAENSDTGVYFVNYRKQSDWSPAMKFPGELIFSTGTSFIEYGIKKFSFAEWDSGKLTYLSSLVVNRSCWNAIKHKTRHDLHPAYTVHSFMPGCKVVAIGEPLTIHKNKTPSPRWLIYHWLKLYMYMGMKYGQRVHFAYIAIRTLFAHLKYTIHIYAVVTECKLCDGLKNLYRKIFLHKKNRTANQYAKP